MNDVPLSAIELIKRFEGFSAKPYLCPAGIPTIGYGSTFYETGKKVTMQDAPVDRIKAARMLHTEAKHCAAQVLRMVKVPLSDNQLAALISFTFNLGSGRLKASTLLRELNKGSYTRAATNFDKWVFAGKRKLPGLVIRRRVERKVFESEQEVLPWLVDKIT